MYKWVFSERLKLSGDEHHRIASVRVFQARGPATAKVRSPSVECRIAGTVKSAEEAERRRRRGLIFLTGWMTACRYLGADHARNWKPVHRVYTGCVEGSATSADRRATAWLMWSWSCAPTVRHAAALTTDCSRSSSQRGGPAKATLQ